MTKETFLKYDNGDDMFFRYRNKECRIRLIPENGSNVRLALVFNDGTDGFNVGMVSKASNAIIPLEYITFLWECGVLDKFGRNTLYAISRVNPLYIENHPNERILVNLSPWAEKQALAVLD